MIRVTRRVIRFLGWLLTPLVAWAAAFLGGWLGALLSPRIASPKMGFALMVGSAGVFAIGGVWLWAKGIRRSARLQAWGRRRRQKALEAKREKAALAEKQLQSSERTNVEEP